MLVEQDKLDRPQLCAVSFFPCRLHSLCAHKAVLVGSPVAMHNHKFIIESLGMRFSHFDEYEKKKGNQPLDEFIFTRQW
jgi:hypothetical protein